MTGILSSISGQFSKALILGTFLPVTVFVILLQVFVVPLLPSDWPLLAPLEALGAQWQLLVLTLFAIVLSGLLYNLNTPIIRFYEGYPWRHSWLGKWKTERYQQQFTAAQARANGMRTLLRTLTDKHEHYQDILREWNQIQRHLNAMFPGKRDLVLPTRLGNVIRSQEHYSDLQYSIDAITLWPRLIASIPKDYIAALDDAKVALDFMLNSSLLSAILALAALSAGLFYPPALPVWDTTWALWLPWLFSWIAFALLSYLFYLGAISRASAWGALVKSAFDLYRWDLLKQLGYTQPPATPQEERKLWQNISRQMIYGTYYTGPRPSYTPLDSPSNPTTLQAHPSDVVLIVNRGFAPQTNGQLLTVVLQVQNPSDRPVEQVIVTDTVPSGFGYAWGSAQIAQQPVSVTGRNPYQFRIGHLSAQQQVELTYTLVALNDTKQSAAG